MENHVHPESSFFLLVEEMFRRGGNLLFRFTTFFFAFPNEFKVLWSSLSLFNKPHVPHLLSTTVHSSLCRHTSQLGYNRTGHLCLWWICSVADAPWHRNRLWGAMGKCWGNAWKALRRIEGAGEMLRKMRKAFPRACPKRTRLSTSVFVLKCNCRGWGQFSLSPTPHLSECLETGCRGLN